MKADEQYAVFNEFADGSRQYLHRAVDMERAVETFSDTVVATSAWKVVVTNGRVSLVWTLSEGIRKELIC